MISNISNNFSVDGGIPRKNGRYTLHRGISSIFWGGYTSIHRKIILLFLNYTNSWPLCLNWHCYRIHPFYKFREISIEHMQRVRLADRGLLPLGHLVLPNLWLAYVLILRPVFPKPVTFSDFEFRISIGTTFVLWWAVRWYTMYLKSS